MSLDELEDKIYAWLVLVTARTVISAGYDEQGKPSSPYCNFEIKNTKPFDKPVVNLSNDGLTESIETLMEVSIKIMLVGGNAMTTVNRVVASAWAASRNHDLWDVSGLGSFSNPIDLTALETGTQRQRWETNLILYATISEEFTGEYQEKFNLIVNENDKGLIYEVEQPINKTENC